MLFVQAVASLFLLTAKLAEKINQSPFDENNYEAFRIKENDMDVLVISHPKFFGSGAVIDVKTGYFFDPFNKPGVAHLTEHMLMSVIHKVSVVKIN